MSSKKAFVALLCGISALVIILLASDRWLGTAATFYRQSVRPNVVLIIIDTLRADKLGTYGFPGSSSPEIDAIAREGVIFSRVVSQSSWTRPSIGSMLTSAYPRQLGIYHEKWDVLPQEAVTLAEMLKEAGYSTLGITANPSINRFFQFDQGFDRYIDSDLIFPWMKKEQGKRKATKKNGLWRADKVLQLALDEVEKLPQGPYYLQINLMDVHGGVRAPARKADVDLQQYADAGYLQRVRGVSREVAAFIATLKDRPDWRNTIFILTSDHGEGLSDHPAVQSSRTHGFLLYRSQLWVPLIVYQPGASVFRSKRVDQTVRLLDLVPTILEAVGVSSGSELQGRSLMPLLESDTALPPLGAVFAETSRGSANKSAVYSDRFIYIENDDEWKGVPAEELQDSDGRQDGVITDVGVRFPREKEELKKVLRAIEERYPAVHSSNADQSPPSDDVARLKSLGYLN